MLRIAGLAILAISVPTFAQSRRGGPGNLDQKLNQILERLERLEQHVKAQDGRRAEHQDKQRAENLHKFLREFDRVSDSHARQRRPHRDHDRARPNRQRGPQRDFRGGSRHPMGRLPQIIAAAKQGDPRARQMLTRLRAAIDDALGGHAKKPRKGFAMAPQGPAKAGGMRFVTPTGKFQALGPAPRVELRVQALETAKVAEVRRRKAEVKKAHADIVIREKKAKAYRMKIGKKQSEFARITKLMTQSKRLQAEIEKLRAELAQGR